MFPLIIAFTLVAAAAAQTPAEPAAAQTPAEPAADVVPPAEPPDCGSATAWPGADWTSRADAVATAHPEAVAALDAWLFPPTLDRADPERRGVRTDGVVIVHHGEIVYERYGGGYTVDTPHLAWSASKSFTAALAAVAMRDGLLGLDDSICDHMQGVRQESCVVTVKDLLEFSSGWDWRETYEGQSPTTSSVLAMLYGEGRGDMASFVANHPLRDPPGSTWMYSSGDTNVLARVVGNVLAPRYGDRFPWAVLLDPIGMRHATFERDGSGTYVGSSYLWAPPRDLARFGLLLLQDGCWQGERLLPEGWVAASTVVNEPIRKKALEREPGDVQGRTFWLNRTVPEAGQTELPWPDVPEGAFAALGHWQQGIYVIPDDDLVVVHTGDDRDGSYSHDDFLRLVLALVEVDR